MSPSVPQACDADIRCGEAGTFDKSVVGFLDWVSEKCVCHFGSIPLSWIIRDHRGPLGASDQLGRGS